MGDRPVLAAIGLAVVLAARATGALPVLRELPLAAAALGAWALLAAVLAGDLGEHWIGGVGVAPGTINHVGMPDVLVWIAAGAAALALAAAAAAEWLASARQPVGDEPVAHRPGEPQPAHGT